VFAPRMKAVLLRTVVLARRHRDLAESTRREYRRRLERDLNGVMVLAPNQRDGKLLRNRYGKLREHLFTFLSHPEVTADNNGSERELRPTSRSPTDSAPIGGSICSPLSAPSSAPPNAAGSTPIRQFVRRYRGRVRSCQVEQLLSRCAARDAAQIYCFRFAARSTMACSVPAPDRNSGLQRSIPANGDSRMIPKVAAVHRQRTISGHPLLRVEHTWLLIQCVRNGEQATGMKGRLIERLRQSTVNGQFQAPPCCKGSTPDC
jgi:hypothetical protein